MSWNDLDKYEQEDVAWGIDKDFTNYVIDRSKDERKACNLMCSVMLSAVRFVDGKPQLQMKELPAFMREWLVNNRNNEDYCGYFDR